MSRLKTRVVRAVTGSGLANACRPLTQDAATVFTLHRFDDPERGVSGHDPRVLRQLLAYLRRRRYRLVSLDRIVGALAGEAPPIEHAVAFTIDDGYLEQATIAGPVFAEFDCPVTTFVTTGFLDGRLWFWWDRIEYILTRTTRDEVSVALPDGDVRHELAEPGRRAAAQADFIDRCKRLREPDKIDAIRRLAESAEVDVPATPPAKYAPMDWSTLRAAERLGMSFGPHTVTHPILARTDDAQSTYEITESWSRLQSEARHPVPIFAYPNGHEEDVGPREFTTMRQVGIRGGVIGLPRYATARRFRERDGEYLIPRFPCPTSLPNLIQQVTGMERLKLLLRGID